MSVAHGGEALPGKGSALVCSHSYLPREGHATRCNASGALDQEARQRPPRPDSWREHLCDRKGGGHQPRETIPRASPCLVSLVHTQRLSLAGAARDEACVAAAVHISETHLYESRVTGTKISPVHRFLVESCLVTRHSCLASSISVDSSVFCEKKLLTQKTGTPISLPLSILSWSSRAHTPLPRDRVQAMATVGHTSVAGGSLP